MNPYWINPAPDTDQWLHADQVKSNFLMLVVGHVALWIVSLLGVVFLITSAQSIAPVQAFTAQGEPAWGNPVAINTTAAQEKQETFLNLHLKNVFTHLFLRTEKGALPELKSHTTAGLMDIIEANFGFAQKEKAGYSQSFYIGDKQEDFELLQRKGSRRVYRVHGTLSAHSLSGSSNTQIYLIAAADKQKPTPANPLGWAVSTIISVDAAEYYNKERLSLVEEVTKPRQGPATTPTNTPKNNRK